jgi:hypothetical protein
VIHLFQISGKLRNLYGILVVCESSGASPLDGVCIFLLIHWLNARISDTFTLIARKRTGLLAYEILLPSTNAPSRVIGFPLLHRGGVCGGNGAVFQHLME